MVNQSDEHASSDRLRRYVSRHGAQQTPPVLRELVMQKLAHVRGTVMWDVGAGSGSIAIEWKLSRPQSSVYAIERFEARCEDIAYNAHLHNAHIDILHKEMEDIPDMLPVPDMIFLGCPGESATDLSPLLWERLALNGWIASNAVSRTGVARLYAAKERFGGEISEYNMFDLPRTQWIAQKL